MRTLARTGRRLLTALALATVLAPSAPAPVDIARALDLAPPPWSRAGGTATAERRGRPAPPPSAGRIPTPEGRPVAAGRLIVGFRPGADAPAREDAHRAAGAGAIERLALPDTVAVQVAPDAVDRALAAYRANPAVAWAEADHVVRAAPR